MWNAAVHSTALMGAWIMVRGAMALGAAMAPDLGTGINPTAGMLDGPAALVGALFGALLAALIFPRC